MFSPEYVCKPGNQNWGTEGSLLREMLPLLLVAHHRLLKTLQTFIAGYRESDHELARKLSLLPRFHSLEGAIQEPGGEPTSIILAVLTPTCYNTD